MHFKLINPDKVTSVILNLKYLLINPINWVYLSVKGELQINIKALHVAADHTLYTGTCTYM